MNYDYLTDQARRLMWCAPDQDYQAILEPKRISPSYGVRKTIKVMWNTIFLPNQVDVFHVFVVGQLNPRLLGLFPVSRQWRSFGQNMKELGMLANLYNEKGVQLLRAKAWYKVTEDKNLIIAIRRPSRVKIDVGNERIYLRVYSNAFFNSARNTHTETIRWDGRIVESNNDVLVMQAAVNHLNAMPGSTTCFVNGRVVREINLITARVGDEVEYVHDSSVVREVFLTLGELRRYTSTMDGIGKYLIAYPDDEEERIVRYQDDVDVYLFTMTGPNEYDGVYVHKNDPRTLRMVTFRDYGLAINVVSAIAQNHAWSDENLIQVRITVRDAGLELPAVYEHNRTHELFKLPFTERVGAMVGINSNVSVWKAENLEASAYTGVMRHRSMNLPKALVDNAFGYNAASSLVAMTPQKANNVNGELGVQLPYLLTREVTVYEHDAQGKLIGVHGHEEGLHYMMRTQAGVLADVVKGRGSNYLSDTYNERVEAYNRELDYRFYICDVRDGVVQNNWRDVTDSGYYIITDGEIRWSEDPEIYTMTRKSDTFLSYGIRISPLNGVLRFSLRNVVYRDLMTVDQVMQVPMGELDIYLNGHPLIEGIDYTVKFPQIVIFSNRFFTDDWEGEQDIHIRFTGFCNEKLEYQMAKEVGFIKHGLASNNRRFNVRDDKVVRTIINGSLIHREDITFAEDGTPVVGANPLNGLPYLVRDVVVPMRPIVDRETYEYIGKSRVVDEEVENYLTLRYPSEEVNAPNPINSKYPLHSPFISAIIADLKRGVLAPDFLYDQYSDDKAMSAVTQYEYLLDYDPSQLPLRIDQNYVEIHPTPSRVVIDLPVHQYRFVQRMVDLYCNGYVKLSHFLAIRAF